MDRLLPCGVIGGTGARPVPRAGGLHALRREIREELETEIHVGELIDTIEYDYPDFHLSMRCYVCEIISGNLHLIEHEAARWLTADQLYSVAWLPADITLIPKIVRYSYEKLFE